MLTDEDYAAVLFGPSSIGAVDPQKVDDFQCVADQCWTQYSSISRTGLGLLPRLVHVTSLVAIPHAVDRSDGSVIYFDSGVSQILRQFLRISFNRSYLVEADLYLHKLYAQRCFNFGDMRNAAFFGVAVDIIARSVEAGSPAPSVGVEYQVMNQFPLYVEPDEVKAAREVSLQIQEEFILRHELAHVALRRSGKLYDACAESARHLLRGRSELFEYSRSELRDRDSLIDEGTREYFDDIRRNYLRVFPERSTEVPDSLSPGVWQEVRNRVEASLPDVDAYIRRLDQDSSLEEEVLCDLMALSSMIDPSDEPENVAATVASGLAALYGLRLVQSLDLLVSHNGTDEHFRARARFLESSQARLNLVRYALPPLAHIGWKLESRETADLILETVADWNVSFRRAFEDYLALDFRPDRSRWPWMEELQDITDFLQVSPDKLREVLIHPALPQ